MLKPEERYSEGENEVELPEIMEEVEVEELAIDGICGVY